MGREVTSDSKCCRGGSESFPSQRVKLFLALTRFNTNHEAGKALSTAFQVS